MKNRGRPGAWEGTGGPFPEPTRHHPHQEQAAWLVWFWGAWFSPQLEGWAGQAGVKWGYSWRGFGASRATAPLCPPGLPFKATQCCLGGDKIQIRRSPGSSEPGCGLVQGVRGARNSNQTGPSGQTPAGRLPDPARSHHGPVLRLGLHRQHLLPRDLGLAPAQGVKLTQGGGRRVGSLGRGQGVEAHGQEGDAMASASFYVAQLNPTR